MAISSKTLLLIGVSIFLIVGVLLLVGFLVFYVIPKSNSNGNGGGGNSGNSENSEPSEPSGGGNGQNNGGSNTPMIGSGKFTVTATKNFVPFTNQIMTFGAGRTITFDPNVFQITNSNQIQVQYIGTGSGTINVSFTIRAKQGKNYNVGASFNMNSGSGYKLYGSGSGKGNATWKNTDPITVSPNYKFSLTSNFGNSLSNGTTWSITFTPTGSPP